MNNILKKHRIIGIRHTLRHLKDAGLVEEESNFPKDAVSNIQGEVLSTANSWYKIGAKRGGLEVLDAFLNGHFKVVENPDGTKEIIANIDDGISWSRALKVRVGAEVQRVEKRKYQLTIKALGFE